MLFREASFYSNKKILNKKLDLLLANSKKRSTFAAHLGIVLWCNGSTPDSGSVCVGSNPTRTTKLK